MQIGLQLMLVNECLITGENVAESGKIARSGFGQGDTPGMAAGAGTDGSGLEQHHGFGWGKGFQANCGSKSAEASADDGEIDRGRERMPLRTKINSPGPVAPVFLGIHRSSRCGGYEFNCGYELNLHR